MFNWIKNRLREKKIIVPKLYNIYQVDWTCKLMYVKLGETEENFINIARRVQVTDYEKIYDEFGYRTEINYLLKDKVTSPLEIGSCDLSLRGFIDGKEYAYRIQRTALFKWNTEYNFKVTKLWKTEQKDFYQNLNPWEQNEKGTIV